MIHNFIFDQEKFRKKLAELIRYGWKYDDPNFLSYLSIIALMDLQVKPVEIYDALPSGEDFLPFTDLMNAFANLGILCHKSTVINGKIDDRLLPFLYLPEECREIPLVGVERKVKEGEPHYVVYNPFESVLEDIPENQLNGDLYFFSKESLLDNTLTKKERALMKLSWFKALLSRFRPIGLQVISVSLVMYIISLSVPIFVMLIYNKVIGSHSLNVLPLFCTGMGLALLSEWFLRNLRSQVLSWFSSRIDFLVGSKIFNQLMFLPLSMTEVASVSAQLARIKSFDSVRDFFTGSVFTTLIELPFTLFLLAVIGVFAGNLVWIPVVLIGVYAFLFFYFRPIIGQRSRLAGQHTTKKQQMFIETLEKMPAIRCSSVSRAMFMVFSDLSGKASYLRFQASVITSFVDALSHILYVSSGVLAIYFGIHKVWAGEMSVGGLVLTTTLIWRALMPIKITCSSLSRFEQVKGTLAQINKLMDISGEDLQRETTSLVGEVHGRVTLNKVGLRYGKDFDPVFTGLSIDVKKGEIIAIRGDNGSGKSSILKLLLGVYRPQMGVVTIDDKDIRQLDPIDLRKSIGYVPQEPIFFRGTILENLRVSNPFAKEEELKLTLINVGAWEDIEALPDGIHTELSEEFREILNTGLGFRLNLARAIIKKSRLLLVDELPYSVMSTSAGEKFKDLLKQWRGSRTVFMVTHRKDLLGYCDRCIVLRKGRTPKIETMNSTDKPTQTKETTLAA